MAMEGEEPEYESDPEDSLLPAMRRREASDDEEGEGSDREEKPARTPAVGSNENSDGEGGAPAYEDEGEEGEEVDEEEIDEEEYGSEEYDDLLDEDADYADDARGAEGRRGADGDHSAADGRADDVADTEAAGRHDAAVGQAIDGQNGDYEGQVLGPEGERKENEPFAVPKAGAFYMHDDRFREQGGGRQRSTAGRRKLWESKDDRAWVHDRFEEMSMQEAHNEEGRRYRGRYRGRGRARGAIRDYGRGRRPQVFNDRFRDRNERVPYDDRNRDYNDRTRTFRDRPRVYNRNQAYDDNNQTRAPKIVKGRGPRRYESLPKTSQETPPPQSQSKPSMEVHEPNQKTSVEKQSLPTSDPLPEPVAPRKQVFASSLNIASPPFYPSGSANLDSSMAKLNMQTSNINRHVPGPMLTDSLAPSSSALRGKAVANYIPQERSHAEDSLSHSVGKPTVNLHAQPSASPPVTATQNSQPRFQGRGLPVTGQFAYHQDLSQGQIPKVPAQLQLPSIQQRPVQASLQPVLQVQHQRGGMASSATSSQSAHASEMGDTDNSPGTSKSKSIVAVGGRGKAINAQAGGRGPFLYAGTPVIGANNSMGLVTGENFPGTPALLPVMQFSGQNPGGVGVGMALPGYVAQAQSGFGSSEMTWVPVLASAPGALGASYGPYIALDGGLYAHPTGQISSSSSRDSGSNKAVNMSKAPPKPEMIHDELGQRQNKPRRYSEMNFGQ